MNAKYWILTGFLAAVAIQAMATPGGPVIVTEDGEVLTAKGPFDGPKGPGRRPPLVKPAPKPAEIDWRKSGTYASGKWRYEYTYFVPGDRPHGRFIRYALLFYDGKPVAKITGAKEGDRIKTPWGMMQYFGRVLKEDHRTRVDCWLRARHSKGRLLPSPEKAAKPAPTAPKPGKRPITAKEIAAVAKSGNDFATNLYAKLAGKEKGNLFFSPASIHTALAMTYAGARGNTEKQMFTTLRFPIDRKWGGPPPVGNKAAMVAIPISAPWSQDRVHPAFGALIKKLNTPRKVRGKPAYELVVANALWGQKGYPFKEEFTKTVKANYDAGLEEVDYVKATEASRKKINAWVEKKTKQKIKDLIPRGVVNPDTRLVLTNAIYFKSNWDEKFEKSATREGDFHIALTKAVRVPFMHQQESHNYLETDNFQAVEIYYKYGDLSMVIFLPKSYGRPPFTIKQVLAAFEKTLTEKNLAKWIKQMKSTPVRLTLPKFKFTSQFGLAEILKAMGMADAFSAAAADFSGMTTADKLFISAVIHKAFVAVDEEGTEAAAATAVVIELTAMPARPKQPKVFKADHPFVFMIRHRATGSILFMGRVMNPK